MVKLTFVGILATSIAAHALGAAIPRDVVVAEGLNGLDSRDELSQLVKRKFEDFAARALSEFVERELEFDDSMITRKFSDISDQRRAIHDLEGLIFEARLVDGRKIIEPCKQWVKVICAAPAKPQPGPSTRDYDDDVFRRSDASVWDREYKFDELD
ncbi:hypothetical protein BKA70DRAFT_1342193 [Coprinopsis sp. MPI-PUGE-AT-0042]|nr:hypothetical protein BKA70DRAFT_1342193 [Coprinopsis sp. MPI-PUGE-AT-0042]